MPDSRRIRRSRGAVAALTAVLLVPLGALTGCDSSDSGNGARSESAHRASPSPSPAWDTRPRSVAAVGDSITRGFDACSVLSDCPRVSWATGTDTAVHSLVSRLGAKESWNDAKTGALMADVPAQIDRAVAHRPELVTIMAGANDACRTSVSHMTPVDEFRTSFETALKRLRTALPESQVYVSSVPDLKRLWSQGRTNPLGKEIWKLGICSSMLRDSDAMDPAAVRRRDTVRDRVIAYNEVLKDVCATDRHCRYDGGAVFDYPFTQAQLSRWDWFHPGRNGQEQLAAIAYRNVTAVRPPA
ncbi:GDSL-type esterase/lipase family protein [Streptomyces sp. NBC_01387]|uniref:SGNH/GDSL hydrolase family protein n=1 Tax=unclassified Streptomyces TaxID=2593676 RepID=UPI0020240F42|nr:MULTISPECIES: SGNH/GDSL hydrolase family protein [unclassified Streptomyces]WSC22692.1 GDSL-type esterase/lipase family protein [Streptomyces sp. NBC_01766]WSV56617.1 GDSL-type esterase/lipase family protein [Streptomyces sp. NBC_01014]